FSTNTTKPMKSFCSPWLRPCAKNTARWFQRDFVLQIDDPGLPDRWDMIKPEPTVEEYRKFAKLRIEAVNHALRHSGREGALPPLLGQLARSAYSRLAAGTHRRSGSRG